MYSTVLFFLLMFILSCMGQVISDIYLPALTIISQDLHTSIHAIQLSISLYFYGFAGSHLIYGPISDSTGRKKPLAIGILICLLGSLICEYATTITLFNMGRLLQGVGAGASAVLYRSILRDLYSGNRLATVSSYLSIGRIFLLASSPLIGAYLLHFFSWHMIFFFLFIYSSLCLLGTLGLLKETNDYTHLHKTKLYPILKNSWTVLKSPVFMGYALCIMLTFGVILAWLTVLPIVLQKTLGLSPIAFGWLSALAGLSFAIGGFINALLVNQLGINRMLNIGLFIMLCAGFTMLTLGLCNFVNTVVIMLPVIIFIIGSSMIFPNAYAGAFHPFPKIAGTASAIFGFLQMLGGAISSTIMSYTHAYNQIPLAIALISVSMLGLFFIFITSRMDATGEIVQPSESAY